MKQPLLLRRLATVVLLSLCFCLVAQADPITRQQAQQRAEAFLQNAQGSKRLSPVRSSAKLAPRHKAATTDFELYYVFNRGDQEGYVIASGDDKTLPVLGYTDSGEFDYKQLPDNMRAWLTDYETQLAYLREHPELLQTAPHYAPVHAAIEPMVTSHWSQGAPYNNECPMYFNLGRSVTGCVATAMAQLLYYWRDISVTETQAAMPAYDTWTSHDTFGNLHVEGIPANSPIDWANMIDNYGGSYTGKQATAVAQLMHYCGVAVHMDYTNASSGAQSAEVATGLTNYFGYGSSVKYVQGNNYSADGWDQLLYKELAEGRPFYLSGANSEAGHAFVCDGYDGNHCFHINWGWGGMSDGYFLLNSLNPSSQGIGGSGDGYSGWPEAIIGVQPPANGTRAMAFANAIAKRLCVANFDADGDGTLTYAEAAAVKDLGNVFKGQRMTSFAELRYFTGLTTLGDSAFSGCTALTEVSLPKQLTSIGKGAFAGCKALKSLSFSSGITEIDDDAFNGCAKLTNITLPSNIATIGARAFKGCAALTTMSLPVSLSSIGDEAFAGCTKLATVTVETMFPKLMNVGANVFEGINLSAAELNNQQGTEEFFSTTAPWNQFGTIISMRNLAQGHFAELAENTPYYIYNLGTGRYLTKGEAWGTQAVVAMTDEPMRFEMRRPSSLPAGVYYLYSGDTGKDGHYMFRTSSDPKVGNGVKACFVDGTLESNATAARWKIEATENGTYTIQTASGSTGYVKTQFLGVDPNHASNEASPTYGAYSDIVFEDMPLNCQWMLVPYDADRMDVYAAAMQLANLLEVGQQRHLNVTYELSVYNDMTADKETLLRTARTLRKRMNLINFANDAVRKACVGSYDANGDGELSYDEAKSVQYLHSEAGFRQNTDITTFDELQYFTGVTGIYYNTFYGCTNLQRISLPDAVTNIGWQAFRECTSLQSVEMGRNINSIAENSFEKCTALREVRIAVEDPSTIAVEDISFNGVDLSKATLYVPQGSKELYAAAPVWKDFGSIVEMHVIPAAGASELLQDEQVYVRNVGAQLYISKGEAWGTQAVGETTGFIYRLRRTNKMPEGQYYLEAVNNGESGKILFRTSSDSKVGTGVKACFVDGTSVTAKAYWQVEEVDAAQHLYTLQVPAKDTEYVEGEYLGHNAKHTSEFAAYGTNGFYYDVEYASNPQACQWQFIRLSDIEEVNRQTANLQVLRQLIVRANNKEIDVQEEEAVYDKLTATDDEVLTAIASLRTKLHYIEFVDAKAKTICVNYWDEDEDGDITEEEAASVTDIRAAFAASSGLITLEDLRHFTGLTSIPAQAFRNCSSLQAVWIPAGVTSIGEKAFDGLNALRYIVLMNPAQKVTTATASANTQTLFVPASLVETYAADEQWQKSRITEYTGKPVVTPDHAERNYGRSNPTFTYHVDGAPIIGQPELAAETAEATSPVGDYAITCSLGTITTEGVTLNNGVLTINPSPVTITAGSYTRNIGEENPEFELTYHTFRNREKADDVLLVKPTVECDATKDSPAGVYEIRVFGAEAQNYTFTYENGILTIIDPVGVTDITTGATVGTPTYDLTGRRVSTTTKPAKSGLYILGGKKVVVK